MSPRRLKIVEMARTHPIHVVGPQDFVAEVGEEISIAEVIADPKFSLYCFDLTNEAALFVEVDDSAAVENAPFYYQAQYNHAIGLVSVPLERFHRAAPLIPKPSTKTVFVHSVGRCGSTLLSKILQGIPNVHSLSEPDDTTQLGRFRTQFGLEDPMIEELLVSSVGWRCKPRLGPDFDTVAIKMRSEVLVLDDLFARRFQASKHIFLYREALSWSRSIIQNWPADRDFSDVESNRAMRDGWATTLPMVKEYQVNDIDLSPIQIRILAWITCMEAYLRLQQSGTPIRAARFEDLTSNPAAIIGQLLTFCEIDPVEQHVMQAILDRDSQAGTLFDREERKKQVRELTDDLVEDVKAMIADRPMLRHPDVLLPGTLSA